MSEMGEIYKALKESKKKDKEVALVNSMSILKQHRVSFTKHNDGWHLVIRIAGRSVADFWPSTQKYKIRSTSQYGRGVYRMLEVLGLRES